jgi:hypothetical protein
MRYYLLIALALFFTACSSISVDTDYNPAYDFHANKRFVMAYKPVEGSDTLTDDRIMAAITAQMERKGFTHVKASSTALQVHFKKSVTTKTEIETDYSYGMYPYGRRGAMLMPTTTVSTYEEGKLVIDIVDPSTDKVVWRGIGTDSLDSFDTPAERTAYINDVIAQIMQNFPPEVRP